MQILLVGWACTSHKYASRKSRSWLKLLNRYAHCAKISMLPTVGMGPCCLQELFFTQNAKWQITARRPAGRARYPTAGLSSPGNPRDAVIIRAAVEQASPVTVYDSVLAGIHGKANNSYRFRFVYRKLLFCFTLRQARRALGFCIQHIIPRMPI